MTTAILFDLDGVLTLPEEMFSVLYTRSHSYDIEPFTEFFKTEWPDFVTGKKDLKEHIVNYPDFWKWDKSAGDLLDFWFKAEDVRNADLLELIQRERSRGVKCYIVTEQEKYRTAYIRDIMFTDDFDGVFSTAEIGFKKNDRRFFERVASDLGVEPSEIIYFDDSQSKLDAAKQIGIQTFLYKSPEQVKAVLS